MNFLQITTTTKSLRTNIIFGWLLPYNKPKYILPQKGQWTFAHIIYIKEQAKKKKLKI